MRPHQLHLLRRFQLLYEYKFACDSSSGETVAVLPDYFVEGAMLFKRKGRYYVMYGSCCCACRSAGTASEQLTLWSTCICLTIHRALAGSCGGMPNRYASNASKVHRLFG